jgi:orotidine-5'-phosphate decarboxylase
LAAAVKDRRTPAVVGLDPRLDQLPSVLQPRQNAPVIDIASAYFEFCRQVIDAVADRVAAVKLQLAFFEQLGPAGMTALAQVMRYARERRLLVIADGKRNDIGSTATAYASAFLANDEDGFPADALTASPYLGDDSLQPFCDAASIHGNGLFVLVKTSNPGGTLFQDLIADGKPVYAHVAQFVDRLAKQTLGACGYGSIGSVVGATYPKQLLELRTMMPSTWILVPGYGAQGGTAADVGHAFDARGLGAVVNSSRAIIFAYNRPELQAEASRDWRDAIVAATEEMISELREHTAAGNL